MGVEGADPSAFGLGLPPAVGGGRNGRRRRGAEADPPPGGPRTQAPPRKPAPALMVETSVRSGQSIIFPEGDVTVIGSVASGAEVVAGGSIHIYGTLRGRAIAGTMGNAAARIFCRKLEAELLAIDGLYKTADDIGPDASRRGRAGLARRRRDQVMAALD